MANSYKSNSSKVWVSDIIGDNYKNWHNEFVVLSCDTGCGKSYFCIHVLGTYAKACNKKILYLCNRSKLREKIYRDVGDFGLLGVIYVSSYQSLQKKIQSGEIIPEYDYIVADECHYFRTDAKFNSYTDISYKYLMHQKNSVVIWVSATAKVFFQWMIDKSKVKKKNVYSISKSYSYVKNVYFYQKNELQAIIDDILENDPKSKVIVFCNAADRILEMNQIFADNADYYCSNTTQNANLKKVCGYSSETGKVKDCIQVIDGKITFEKRILFTTIALDNGIDLKDENIKHIFSEVVDVDSMIQVFGRKRIINEKDTCSFYIREYQPKAIQGMININEEQLNPVKAYKEDYDNFYKEYGSGKGRSQLERNKIFYSYFTEDKYLSKIKVNECRYSKYEQDNIVLRKMKKTGYIPVVKEYLGEELASKSERITVDVREIDLFMNYLKSIEGKPLYMEDRKQIKERFELIGAKLRYIGINTFNGVLDDVYKDLYRPRFQNRDCNDRYFEDTKRKLVDGSDNPNYKKKFWILKLDR